MVSVFIKGARKVLSWLIWIFSFIVCFLDWWLGENFAERLQLSSPFAKKTQQSAQDVDLEAAHSKGPKATSARNQNAAAKSAACRSDIPACLYDKSHLATPVHAPQNKLQAVPRLKGSAEANGPYRPSRPQYLQPPAPTHPPRPRRAQYLQPPALNRPPRPSRPAPPLPGPYSPPQPLRISVFKNPGYHQAAKERHAALVKSRERFTNLGRHWDNTPGRTTFEPYRKHTSEPQRSARHSYYAQFFNGDWFNRDTSSTPQDEVKSNERVFTVYPNPVPGPVPVPPPNTKPIHHHKRTHSLPQISVTEVEADKDARKKKRATFAVV